jgi:SAM-dependent MidA family methyltransferase
MDLALYDPQYGYYARRARRSGRAGDFFTSVDVGPLFGELIESQLAEMAEHLEPEAPFDLVEAGASDGRLAADILRAARRRHPALYDRTRLHLVDASPQARDAQRVTLGELSDRLVSSSDTLPSSFSGVLLANELLDALPAHQIVMREEGLREVFVSAAPDGALFLSEGALSTPRLREYLERLGITLEPGWRAEINLCAAEWIKNAARRLHRGFIIVIDYGHEARELYSAAHAGGTLTSFLEHHARGSERSRPDWIDRPGEKDLTAHVDFSTVRAAAEQEGLETLGFLDQTYFVLGLIGDATEIGNPSALRTLMMPGGLGSTHKVLILGRNVGRPSLKACSFRQRVT